MRIWHQLGFVLWNLRRFSYLVFFPAISTENKGRAEWLKKIKNHINDVCCFPLYTNLFQIYDTYLFQLIVKFTMPCLAVALACLKNIRLPGFCVTGRKQEWSFIWASINNSPPILDTVVCHNNVRYACNMQKTRSVRTESPDTNLKVYKSSSLIYYHTTQIVYLNCTQHL